MFMCGGGGAVLSAESVRAMTSDQLTGAQKARGGLGRDFLKDRSWSFCQAVHSGGAFGGTVVSAAHGWSIPRTT
jgi:hypothetical protein